MEQVNQPWGWLEPKPRPDCRCPEWMEDECCGGCDGEAGDCGCDPDKYWGLIAQAHDDKCPVAYQAKKHIKSTLCLCKELAAAELAAKSEQFCERCKMWAPDCKCLEHKRQWV